MMRRRLVFPDPEGPRRATSSPVGTVRLTSLTATKAPKVLVTPRTSMDIRVLRRGSRAPLHEGFGHEADEGEEGEQRGDGERGLEVVLVVQDLDVEGQRVRPSPDVPGDDRDRPELA